jgi:hypothetical protein
VGYWWIDASIWLSIKLQVKESKTSTLMKMKKRKGKEKEKKRKRTILTIRAKNQMPQEPKPTIKQTFRKTPYAKFTHPST